MGKLVKNRLKLLRVEKDKLQKEVADDLGVTRQTVSRIETGKHMPTIDLVLDISKYFNKPIEEIFFKEYGTTKNHQ